MKKIVLFLIISFINGYCIGQNSKYGILNQSQAPYSFLNTDSYDFFQIRHAETQSKYNYYINKTVVFFEPLNEYQKKFDMKNIRMGIPYKIKDIQLYNNIVTITIIENNIEDAEQIILKCGNNYLNPPTIWDIPMYIKDDYEEALNTFVGKQIIYNGKPCIITDIEWIVMPTKDYDFRHSYFILEDTENGVTKKESMNAAFSGSYHSTLTKVEKPSDESIRYGESKTVMIDSVTRYSYVDNIIDIVIYGDSKGFYFHLKNVSENSLKIIWNEAVFVGLDGMTSKIMHSGTKYSQKEGDQPASIIIRGAKINDMAIPISNVSYNKWLKDWSIASMYPNDKGHDGQVQLMLPIQIKETVNEYIFIFDVKYTWKHPELHHKD